MEIKKSSCSALFKMGFYLKQIMYLVPIVITIHYCQVTFINPSTFRYAERTNLEIPTESQCKQLSYEMAYLRREISYIKQELENIKVWRSNLDQNLQEKFKAAFDKFYSDQIGMFDYASEYAGGYIVSTPDTVPYPSKYRLRILGALELTVNSQPNLILQDTVFPGKCYSFYGNKGRIIIGLIQPIIVTHISLEHLRIGENVNTALKDFQILGIMEKSEEFLGAFSYSLEDPVIQTFKVLPKNHTFRRIELRILSNYGNPELTCVYRFRVHSVNLNF